jgi:hypothetical protein
MTHNQQININFTARYVTDTSVANKNTQFTGLVITLPLQTGLAICGDGHSYRFKICSRCNNAC